MSSPDQQDTHKPVDTDSGQSINALTLTTRFEMARNAVQCGKPFAGDAVRHYLVSLAATFDAYTLHEPANGLLDVKVLEAIDQFFPSLQDYRRLVTAVASSGAAEAQVDQLVDFFRDVIGYKSALSQEQHCVLWSDQYRFIVRELFLSTVAIFMRHQHFDAVACLVGANYASETDDNPQRFAVFDGYAKTLDEFRNRRLQLQRMSVSSDLVRDRVDVTQCDFEDLMQADFVLCLRSLVCDPSFFVRWYPRTLVYADHFAVNGFDVFVTGADAARFAPLSQLFDAANWDALLERFESVYEAWGLARWELAGAPLDFRGYMGLRNPALRIAS